MTLGSPRTIWMVIVAPAAICAAAMEANYTLVRQACAAQRNTSLYVVTIIALLLMIAIALIAFINWRRAGAEWPGEGADVVTRNRFLWMVGIIGAGIFFLVTLAQGIAVSHFNPCQL